MHKNNEGYADPTAGKAINGVRREEYQKYLEELHGIKRGQIITVVQFTGENRQQETLRKYKYRVVELHKHNISSGEHERTQVLSGLAEVPRDAKGRDTEAVVGG